MSYRIIIYFKLQPVAATPKLSQDVAHFCVNLRVVAPLAVAEQSHQLYQSS